MPARKPDEPAKGLRERAEATLDAVVGKLRGRARQRVAQLRAEHPGEDRRALAQRLVKSYARRAGLGGAVTGTLALVTLPVGLPAGIAVTMAVEAALLLALLELYGLSEEGERGRLRLYALWAGGGVVDAARSAGMKAGADLAAKAIAGSLPARIIAKLNPVLVRAILKRLGLGWLPGALKLWPVLGAPVGYAADRAATAALGRAAIATLESVEAARAKAAAPARAEPAPRKAAAARKAPSKTGVRARARKAAAPRARPAKRR